MGRKNIFLIIVAALIVAGAFVVAEYRNSQVKNIVYTAALSTTTNSISSKLLDNDWQNALDKNLPKHSTSTNATALKEKLTPTDLLARDFFARYMELSRAGLASDPQSQQELVGQVLNKGIVLSVPKTYAIKDIKITDDYGADAVKKYGNEVGAVFAKYPVVGRDESVITKEALEKDDSSILKEIDPRIITYKNIIAGLFKISSPRQISNLHLDLINSINKFYFVAQNFRQAGVDPLKGIEGVRSYMDAANSLINTMGSLRDYMSSLNVQYSTSDAGNIMFGANTRTQ